MPNPALPNVMPHHFSVSVPDLEAAIAWYSDILGFELETRFSVDAIPAQAAFLRCRELRLELWQAGAGALVPEARKDPNSDLNTGGTKHIAFAVPDIHLALQELVSEGLISLPSSGVPASPCCPIPIHSRKARCRFLPCLYAIPQEL